MFKPVMEKPVEDSSALIPKIVVSQIDKKLKKNISSVRISQRLNVDHPKVKKNLHLKMFRKIKQLSNQNEKRFNSRINILSKKQKSMIRLIIFRKTPNDQHNYFKFFQVIQKLSTKNSNPRSVF
jgi:hypothetical protein